MKRIIYILLCLLPAVIAAQKANTTLENAISSFKAGDYENAITKFKAAAVLNASNAFINRYIETSEKCIRLHQRASGHFQYERYYDALDLFREILKLNSVDPLAIDGVKKCKVEIERIEIELERTRKAERLRLEKEEILRREEVLWSEAEYKSTFESFQNYIDAYPHGRYVANALRAIDNGRWKIAEKKRNVEALEQFRQDFPGSPHASHAAQLIDTLADNELWNALTDSQKVEGSRLYLDSSKLLLFRYEALEIVRKNDSLQCLFDEKLTEAVQQYEAGNFEMAWKSYDKATYIAPIIKREMPSKLQYIVDDYKYQELMSELQELTRDRQERELNWFLNNNPNTPYRAIIQHKRDSLREIIKREPKFALGFMGFRFGKFHLWNFCYPLTLKITNDYNAVGILTGLHISYYKKEYDTQFWNMGYDSDNKTDEDYDHYYYRLSAYQLSVPLTFRLNFKRLGDNDALHLHASISGIFNYNLTGKCFRVRRSDFINPVTYSLQYAFGINVPLADIELFFKQDTKSVFADKNIIYKFDDGDERNNYKKIDRALRDKYIIGLSLILYLPLYD